MQDLKWRYATKKFDASRSISEEALDILMDSIRLSPSSYGLQPYHILVIRDAALRRELRPACWDQSQITDSSHLFVFTHRSDFDAALIDSYLGLVSDVRDVPLPDLQGYGDFMKKTLLDWPKEHKAAWTARQTYIALGNLLLAAAQLRIDACPMEGFEVEKVNTILGLPEKGLSAAAMVAGRDRGPHDARLHDHRSRLLLRRVTRGQGPAACRRTLYNDLIPNSRIP